MLKAIYSIDESIKNKNIYVYGINRNSIMVFTNLALWGGDISGFIDDPGERFAGDYLMNRPIIRASQVKYIKDAVIVISDLLDKGVIRKKIGAQASVYYCEEVTALNDDLRKKDVYIYGIGGYGEKIYDQCCQYGIKVKAACVTKSASVSIWNGLPVLEIDKISREEDCSFIIATVHASYQDQMLEKLYGYRGDKFLYNYILQHHIFEGRFMQVVQRAISENRRIWVYGKRNDLKSRIMEVLSRYSVQIEGEIDDLNDLMGDSIKDLMVVIAENNEYEVEKACDILDSMGCSLENSNYTSLAGETAKAKERTETSSDLVLGWSNISKNVDYPGFIVHGNDDKRDIRIMVLGNSTSTDGVYRTDSWVEIFYRKLLSEGYPVTIFNGSTCGYGITRELLQLLRDGIYMEVDYIVSLSGVNNLTDHGVPNFFSGDVGHGNNVNLAYGLESRESLYEFWYRNIKIMKKVSELYGAKFFAFLQPMAVREEMCLTEAIMYEAQDAAEGVLEFRRRASQEKNSIYTNIIDLLDKEPSIYIDNCHYSNKGNRIIADQIYSTMIKEEVILKKYH